MKRENLKVKEKCNNSNSFVFSIKNYRKPNIECFEHTHIIYA